MLFETKILYNKQCDKMQNVVKWRKEVKASISSETRNLHLSNVE